MRSARDPRPGPARDRPDRAQAGAHFARALWLAFAEARRWVAARGGVSLRAASSLLHTASGPLCALAFGLVTACGAARVPPPPAEPPPLTDHLPPGARRIVLVRPVELMADPALRQLVDAIFLPERFDAFQAFNGIDPRRLEALAYAEYDTGTVVVVRGGFHATVAVAEMAHRMLPLESQSDEPYYRRAGIYRGERRDAIALDERTLIVVTGAPVLAGRALAGGPRALDADGRTLVDALGSPLIVLWPQPLGLPLDTGVGLLFAGERALGLGIEGAGTAVRLRAQALGDFPPGVEDNLRALFGSLAASDLGSQLGMSLSPHAFRVESHADGVRAFLDIPAAHLARGIRSLLVAELAEIVGDDLVEAGSERAPSGLPAGHP